MIGARSTGPTAALAGVSSGVQAHGIWSGRRQGFVRFAGEAETAIMYTAAALANELKKLAARNVYHSLALAGRDVLGNLEFLTAALPVAGVTLPIMVDCDGQRPEAIAPLQRYLAMVQVTTDCAGPAGTEDRVIETLAAAKAGGCQHALVIAPAEQASDAVILRAVERAREASSATSIIIHPPPGAEKDVLDARWGTLTERAVGLHPDVRLVLRLPGPAGMR